MFSRTWRSYGARLAFLFQGYKHAAPTEQGYKHVAPTEQGYKHAAPTEQNQ